LRKAESKWTGRRSAHWTDWSYGEPVATACRETALVSAHDIMTAPPDFLTVSVHPMARLPDVIRVARPISRTAVVRPIIDRHTYRPRITTIIRSRTVIRSVSRIRRVITVASSDAEHGGKRTNSRRDLIFISVIRIREMIYARLFRSAPILFPFVLNNALVKHGVGHFYESGYVGADHEIAGLSVFFRSVP
jgi:hypothetical protein